MNYQRYIDILSSIVKQPFDYPTQVIARDLAVTARASLIRQGMQKTGGTYPASAAISICLPLTSISSIECCGVDLGCEFPTSEKLPIVIEPSSKAPFLWVGSIDGVSQPFGYLKPSEIGLVKNRKFSAKLGYYTFIDQRIIIIGRPGMDKIKSRQIPADPFAFLSIKTCDDKLCFDIEEFVFFEDYWEDAITKFVLPKLKEILDQQTEVDEQDKK